MQPILLMRASMLHQFDSVARSPDEIAIIICRDRRVSPVLVAQSSKTRSPLRLHIKRGMKRAYVTIISACKPYGLDMYETDWLQDAVVENRTIITIVGFSVMLARMWWDGMGLRLMRFCFLALHSISCHVRRFIMPSEPSKRNRFVGLDCELLTAWTLPLRWCSTHHVCAGRCWKNGQQGCGSPRALRRGRLLEKYLKSRWRWGIQSTGPDSGLVRAKDYVLRLHVF